MKEKIRQYVNYQFRFDKRENLEELKEEVIANLMDRYQEHLNKGKSPEEAYVAAIKSMGNFTDSKMNEIPEEYSIKPSIPDILLMCGAILSIFGFIITLLSPVIGALVTATSILLFSGSAYYLYSLSQFVRKEQMDIEKHNILLTKIFKYMKTSFVFWALSISFILASLVMSNVTKLVLLDPRSISYSSIGDIVLGYFVLFTICAIIFLLLFKIIYDRLINRYYLLTGTTSLKGKIQESYEFLYGEQVKLPRKSSIKSILESNMFLPVIGLLMILGLLAMPFTLWEHIRTNNGFNGSGSGGALINHLFELLHTNYSTYAIITLVSIIMSITFTILSLRNKFKVQWILVLSYYLSLLSTLILFRVIPIYGYDNRQEGTSIGDNAAQGYAIIALVALTLIVIIRIFILSKIEKPKN